MARSRADRSDEDPRPRRIAFLGFGLIGGSIAMALRARGADVEVIAWTPEGRGPEEGKRRGLVDVAARSPIECVAGADLVVLAAPAHEVAGTLLHRPGPFGQALGEATLTDVASTKAAIMRRANRQRARFVGGHPMAGSEASGVESANPDLFQGRPWVVVPGDGASDHDVARVEALARFVGAEPVRMTAEAHDAAVAVISHVPLVASVALVEAMTRDPAWLHGAARRLAATGWSGTTRLAGGSPEMGAGILATNAAEVAPRLRAVRAVLDEWIAELERADGPEVAVLRARLEEARRRREA